MVLSRIRRNCRRVIARQNQIYLMLRKPLTGAEYLKHLYWKSYNGLLGPTEKANLAQKTVTAAVAAFPGLPVMVAMESLLGEEPKEVEKALPPPHPVRSRRGPRLGKVPISQVFQGQPNPQSATTKKELEPGHSPAKALMSKMPPKGKKKALKKAERKVESKLMQLLSQTASTGAGKRRKRNRKGKGKGKGKGLISNMSMAPAVTYNGVYNTASRVSFAGRDHLPLDFRFPVGVITLTYDGKTLEYITTNIINDNTLGAGMGGAFWVNGTENSYAPDQMDDIFSLFNELDWKSLCFEYIPRVQGGTSTGIQLTWGFSGDPEYARTHIFHIETIGGVSVYAPTEGSIRPMRGSQQFSAWVPKACLDVTSHINQKEQYYTSSWSTATGVFTSIAAASLRQMCPGVLYVSGSDNPIPPGVGTSADPITVTCGNLFMEGSVILKEFSPPQTVAVTSVLSSGTEESVRCKRLHPSFCGVQVQPEERKERTSSKGPPKR